MWKQQLEDNAVLVEKAAGFQLEAKQEHKAAQDAKDRARDTFNLLSKAEINLSIAKHVIIALVVVIVILLGVIWAATR